MSASDEIRSEVSVTDDVVDFGSRLRAARLRSRLTQAEVGAGRYSASYVSHLESGRRQPSSEVVAFLADRLGVEAGQLHFARFAVRGADHATMLERLSDARSALRHHDYDRAADLGLQALATAEAGRNPDVWWESQVLIITSRMSQGGYRTAAEMAEELAADDFVAGSPGLVAEALTLASRARRALGEPAAAATLAERAVTRARGASTERLVQALIVSVSASGDGGRMDRARAGAFELSSLLDDITGRQLSGEVMWLLGNVEFLSGDPERGAHWHDRAGARLDPGVDYRAWGRFHRATAQLRLTAGAPTAEIAPYLTEAAVVLERVGNPSDRQDLILTQAEFALADGDAGRVAGILGRSAELWRTPFGCPHLRRDQLVRRAMEALGDPLSAAGQARLNARTFLEHGFDRAAVQEWEEYARLQDLSPTTTGETP